MVDFSVNVLKMKRKFQVAKNLRYLFLTVLLGGIVMGSCRNHKKINPQAKINQADTGRIFVPPDTSMIPHDQFGDMVRYGRELVVHTAQYIGPEGSVGHYLGNKMNCTNCHIDAGTRPFAFNFFTAHARYPQYRGRENKILTLGQRINNCIERPHSGRPLPLDSKEIIAMVCYMKWLGNHTPVGQHVRGDEGLELDYPTRAADPIKGALIYATNCKSCHGEHGEGLYTADKKTYQYPPLWGPMAYQKGSSPHRVLKMARFIKGNMPDKKAFWNKPYLTDEEAIDVAAFINDDRIHIHPEKKDKEHPDYPEIKVKPIDYGSGPYVDTFSEMQHKFGPYKPIIEYHKAKSLPIVF
jgi:thiosulfate dehydrogenase